MKDIQKALEKARMEQQAANEGRVTATGRAAGVSSAVLPKPREETPIPLTRKVSPTPEMLEKHRIIAGLKSHEMADTFRVLRTRVLHRLDGANCSILAVTSCVRGEGKTLTAINLSISLALNLTRTVLLVDLDLRAPRVHHYLGIDASPGLSDYLLRDAPLAGCLVKPGVERLVVLPAGDPVQGSSELLSSKKMTQLATELKTRYADRIIIYDFPPMLASDDALAFIHQVGRCLLVVEDGRTSKLDLRKVVELLAGVDIIGTVLNKSSAETQLHYYKYD